MHVIDILLFTKKVNKQIKKIWCIPKPHASNLWECLNPQWTVAEIHLNSKFHSIGTIFPESDLHEDMDNLHEGASEGPHIGPNEISLHTTTETQMTCVEYEDH